MHRRVAALASAALLAAMLVPAGTVSAASVAHVRAGESIQDAINAAPAGSVIRVDPGTYRGNLEIARSIHLIGNQVVIAPASVPTDNLCLTPGFFNGVVGICIHGGFDLDTGALTPISNVSVEGFTVRNFGGPGLVGLAVDSLRLERTAAVSNGEMGMFINTVTDFSVADSRASGNGADGLFLENAYGRTIVAGNELNGNTGSGLLVINSLGGRISGNELHGNCAGVVIASVAVYGPGSAMPTGDLAIEHNQVSANNRLCPAVPYQMPAYGGIGIELVGSHKVVVARNEVSQNHAQAGSELPGGGILLQDGAIFGASAPTGNTVSANRLSRNTPFDISGDGSGSGNTVTGNSCLATNIGGC